MAGTYIAMRRQRKAPPERGAGTQHERAGLAGDRRARPALPLAGATPPASDYAILHDLARRTAPTLCTLASSPFCMSHPSNAAARAGSRFGPLLAEADVDELEPAVKRAADEDQDHAGHQREDFEQSRVAGRLVEVERSFSPHEFHQGSRYSTPGHSCRSICDSYHRKMDLPSG